MSVCARANTEIRRRIIHSSLFSALTDSGRRLPPSVRLNQIQSRNRVYTKMHRIMFIAFGSLSRFPNRVRIKLMPEVHCAVACKLFSGECFDIVFPRRIPKKFTDSELGTWARASECAKDIVRICLHGTNENENSEFTCWFQFSISLHGTAIVSMVRALAIVNSFLAWNETIH